MSPCGSIGARVCSGRRLLLHGRKGAPALLETDEARKYKRNKWLWVMGGLILIAALSIGATAEECEDTSSSRSSRPTTSPTKPPQLSTEEREEKRKGFHCLSKWDGNHDGLEALVRMQMNDPGSMKTYVTRITPVSEFQQGNHYVEMDFGGKNAFGGMVRHTAHAWVDPDTCEATLLRIE